MPLERMLDFAKTVRSLEIRTAQQIEAKLMHLTEKFRQNLLVEFYSTGLLPFDNASNNNLSFYWLNNFKLWKSIHKLRF